MQERFIQHLWSLQYFDKTNLSTTRGDVLEIFEPGTLNTDAGPDFSNARLRIGNIHWVGNVEIHLHSSGWHDHGHDTDGAYDSVVLHVVWKDDHPVVRRDGTELPTLELSGRVDDEVIRSYRQLMGSSFSIPCQQSFPRVEAIRKHDMVAKALVHRLDRKAAEVISMLHANAGHWEETAYQVLASAFGFKINREPFLQLAKVMPLRILQKHRDELAIEALLFGQAGFLEARRGDDYYLRLQREYRLLAHKYQLNSCRMNRSQWLFLRLRPPNFPSLRLAQFAAVMQHRKGLFSALLETSTVEGWMEFLTPPISPYWASHYQFSKVASIRSHALGEGSVNVIIVNTVVPILAAYARYSDESVYMDRAVHLLEQLPPEMNAIVRRWSDLGCPPQNSFEAQGQIELFNTFCQRKRCLQCVIGTAIVRPPSNETSATP